MSELTVCITTFLRKESLKRCVDSVRKYYPYIRIEVEDTNGNLSAGRNRLVSRCITPYFVLMEDDMEFSADTKLETLLDVVKSDGELIGCGGKLVESRSRNTWMHDWWEFRGTLRAIPSQRAIRISPKGIAYQPCQLIQNFGVFRTEQVKKYPWDEELPIGEHQSWFYSFRKYWLVGYCDVVKVSHYSDRDDGEYNKYRARARNLQRLAAQKIGLKLTAPLYYTSKSDRPNLIVLGIGHSNTSITARQIGELGWNLADADEEFCESVSVRNLNHRIITGESVTGEDLVRTLEKLPEPWVIKDPRFHATLSRWLPYLVPYCPMLLWTRKSLESLLASYSRRGEQVKEETLVDRLNKCKEHYDDWPWAKLILEAENIASAVELFDTSRQGIISNVNESSI